MSVKTHNREVQIFASPPRNLLAFLVLLPRPNKRQEFWLVAISGKVMSAVVNLITGYIRSMSIRQ